MKTEIDRNPLQYAARLTADFALAAASELAGSPLVLDAGCGEGVVAEELVKAGLKVVGIDGNDENAEVARKNGIDARTGLLKDFNHAAFDLILLSRSLHHMPPLAETLKKLDSLLSDRGLIVIEDFGYELIDERAAAWLIEKTREIKAGHQGVEPRHKWLWNCENLTPAQAQALWLEHHFTKHKLIDSLTMKTALHKNFKVRHESHPPYLFRYHCDFLSTTTDGALTAAQLYQEETALIEQGKIPAVGLRLVLGKSQAPPLPA